jgi:hypothetical protein
MNASCSSMGGGDGRVGVMACGLESGAAGERGGVGRAEDAGGEAETVTGVEATTAGAGNILAPHIPQKRFSSEFSFPQRGQRTGPPYLTL